MEVLLTTGGQTYRLVEGDPDVDAMVEYLIADKSACSGKLRALSRQQVSVRLGRTVLPTDFVSEDCVIGDDRREAGYTRGWLESSVIEWEAKQLAITEANLAEVDADETQQVDRGRSGSLSCSPDAAESGAVDDSGLWPRSSQQWKGVPITADGHILIFTSCGVVTPSGVVRTGPLPDGGALARLLVWQWPRKPKELPQLWFTYEALESIGFPTSASEDGDEEVDAKELVENFFDCHVSWSQSGWFTCRFTSADGAPRSAHVVIIPLLDTDPPEQRPGDMGLGGWLDTDTELPEDEVQAVRLLAGRMAWLAGLAEGVLPAARWSTVGAQMLDAVRRAARSRLIQACPLPMPVAVEVGGGLEPIVSPKWSNRPHKPIGDRIDVEVDQRAAYLASAIQVKLGYGTPRELARISVEVFNGQKPPYGIWRLSTPPAKSLDGLTKRLPLPHPAMQWEQESTFWITTRGIQHLSAPVELGGAGLAYAELDISTAWVWPDQSELLRNWADRLRVALIEARETNREDYQDFIKGIYTAYLGRMSTDKWKPNQRHHQQPAWYATIIADTRWRAMRYARRIADTHDLYPVAAELDAWTYRVPQDAKLEIFNEDSPANGKYRVKWSGLDERFAAADPHRAAQ